MWHNQNLKPNRCQNLIRSASKNPPIPEACSASTYQDTLFKIPPSPSSILWLASKPAIFSSKSFFWNFILRRNPLLNIPVYVWYLLSHRIVLCWRIGLTTLSSNLLHQITFNSKLIPADGNIYSLTGALIKLVLRAVSHVEKETLEQRR